MTRGHTHLIEKFSLFCLRFAFFSVLMVFLGSSGGAAGPRYYNINVLMKEPYPLENWSFGGRISAPYSGPKMLPFSGAKVSKRKWPPDNTTKPLRAEPGNVPKEQRHMITTISNPSSKKIGEINGERLQIGLGFFDVTDEWGAAEFRVEWQGKRRFWEARPLAGAMATSDGSMYGYAGFVADFSLTDRLTFSPSFAPGIYIRNGGKKLGHKIEFRSMAEVAYKLDRGRRLGLAIYHLSNASLDKYNPGTEVVSISYTLPLANQR